MFPRGAPQFATEEAMAPACHAWRIVPHCQVVAKLMLVQHRHEPIALPPGGPAIVAKARATRKASV